MRDADTKGGSLDSGCSHKEALGGLPPMAEVMKPSQRPPAEADKSAERGHKLRSNTKGY